MRKAGWEEVFPAILTDVSDKNDFLEAVEELVSAGLVSARWRRFRKGDRLEALYLESPEGMYDALGIDSPRTVSQRMLALLRDPEWKRAELRELAAYLGPRLESGGPVAVRDAGELADLSRLFTMTPAFAAGSPIRALSVRLFADSKRLERLLPVADRLCRGMGHAPLSEALGLSRSYPEVSFALRGSLVPGHGEPPWICGGQVVTLPLPTVSRVERIELDRSAGAAVLSVENKETFHVAAATLHAARGSDPAPPNVAGDSDPADPGAPSAALPPGAAAIVYSGGHPNRAVIDFLRTLTRAGAVLYHYGDLDPDGILILQEIQAAVSTPVIPWLMNVATHRRYAPYGYPLDRGQAARLSLLDAAAHEDLRGLAQELRATGIGVEQEVIGPGGPAVPETC